LVHSLKNPDGHPHGSPDDRPTEREAAPPQFTPPTPVIPDHTLLKRIGAGSYGAVWLARNATGSYRAVKVVYRATFDSDKPYEREFTGIKEFEPISRSHPSQVDILHVGRNDAAGYFYYVMELADPVGEENGKGGKGAEGNRAELQARSSPPFPRFSSSSGTATRRIDPDTYEPTTLRTVLKERGRLPSSEGLNIGAALAEALEHLHAHGLVHREIQPSNIIFVNGRPKLADIGLVARADATLSFVGTEGYLPPEGPGKPAADIYSFGKVLYEMASGKDRQQFPEPPTLLKELPDREAFQELNEVILKACAHDATERYQSAAEMHVELVSLRAGKSLKRSRLLEKRLAQLTKLSVAGVTLTALVIAGYFYQQYQTRVARQYARQNEQLAREKELEIAKLHEERGLRLMEEGDLIGSLPWFAEALSRARGEAEAERRHRFRIGAILRQCPRLLQIIHEPGRVTVAEFSPDGRRVVTTGVRPNAEQYVSVWELPERSPRNADFQVGASRRSETWRYLPEGPLIKSLETGLMRTLVNVPMVLRPDGRRVIVWGQGPGADALHTYDLESGKLIGQPMVHQARIWHALFSPDGLRVLTASADRTARLWQADSGELLATLTHDDEVLSAAMDANGDRILTVCKNGTAYLWNAQTAQRIHVMDLGLKGADLSVLPVFSSDGRWAVIASGDDAQVWVVRTGVKLRTLATKDGMESLRVSPDGELVSTAFRKAQVWEAATGEAITLPLDKGLSYWTTARFSPDGSRVISGSEAGVATIWDARTGADVWPPLRANAGLAWFGNGVRFSPDGRRALMVSRAIRVWDMTGAHSELPTLWHSGAVSDLSFSPDGRWLVTASDDHTARLWDAASGQPVSPPLHHDGPVVLGPFTADGARVLTASFDGTTRLWNANTGEPIFSPLRHGAPLRKAEFSRDGQWIMTVGQDNRVRLWDGATGQQTGTAIEHGDLRDAMFTANSRRVITTGSGTAKAWEVPSGAQIEWAPEQHRVSRLALSPDGRSVLQTLGVAQVLDAETFKPITPLDSHLNKGARSGCWSPDSTKVITTGEDQAARLWDATTGKELVPAMMHPGGVASPTFSADGRWILTIGSIESEAGGALCVWDANSGLLAAPPFQLAAPIRSAAFSPDGHRIIAGATDGSVRALDFSPYEGSVEDLKGIVEVFSGRQIAGTTLAQTVEPEAIKATFDRLRSRFPQYFASSAKDALAWHKREAEDRARSRQRFAANWHVNQVKVLTGDTAE
jgi:WD40 repeat protein